MRELAKEHDKCELCGDKRNLEVHHIIPVCCWGSESTDNLIVLCGSCHAKLSPKSELVRAGIMHKRIVPDTIHNFHVKIYETAEQRICDDIDGMATFDWPDIIDDVAFSLYEECGVKHET